MATSGTCPECAEDTCQICMSTPVGSFIHVFVDVGCTSTVGHTACLSCVLRWAHWNTRTIDCHVCRGVADHVTRSLSHGWQPPDDNALGTPAMVSVQTLEQRSKCRVCRSRSTRGTLECDSRIQVVRQALDKVSDRGYSYACR